MIIDNPKGMQECRDRKRCEWSGDTHGPFEAAHVFACGHGGGRRIDAPWNLVCLKWTVHRIHHDGHAPTTDDLLVIAARRTFPKCGITLACWHVEEALFYIRALPKDGRALRGWNLSDESWELIEGVVKNLQRAG